MSIEDSALNVLDNWYTGLRPYKDGLPSRGSVSAALVLLDRLQAEYKLKIEHHVAAGETQITGLSKKSLNEILVRFGELRTLTKVGGRSNRGARGDIVKLIKLMRTLRLQKLHVSNRNGVLEAMQRHAINKYVASYFQVQRVKSPFDPSCATSRFISGIIENARASGKAGAVAEHLVGAKLKLRFPQFEVRNKTSSTSDEQSGHHGDFEIGTTIFHVTMAPMPELFDKLKNNLSVGKRVYLLVPESKVVGMRQIADSLALGRIAVESVESFIATNIDEQTMFDAGMLKSGLRLLIETYNIRVGTAEVDSSLLIEIPSNL